MLLTLSSLLPELAWHPFDSNAFLSAADLKNMQSEKCKCLCLIVCHKFLFFFTLIAVFDKYYVLTDFDICH